MHLVKIWMFAGQSNILLWIAFIFIVSYIVSKAECVQNIKADVGNETVNNLFCESLLNEIRFIWFMCVCLCFFYFLCSLGAFHLLLQVSLGWRCRSKPSKIIISYMSDECTILVEWVKFTTKTCWYNNYVYNGQHSSLVHIQNAYWLYSVIRSPQCPFFHSIVHPHRTMDAAMWNSMKAHYDMIVDSVILFCNWIYFTLRTRRKQVMEQSSHTFFQIIWDWKCNAGSTNDGKGVVHCAMVKKINQTGVKEKEKVRENKSGRDNEWHTNKWSRVDHERRATDFARKYSQTENWIFVYSILHSEYFVYALYNRHGMNRMKS